MMYSAPPRVEQHEEHQRHGAAHGELGGPVEHDETLQRHDGEIKDVEGEKVEEVDEVAEGAGHLDAERAAAELQHLRRAS